MLPGDGARNGFEGTALETFSSGASVLGLGTSVAFKLLRFASITGVSYRESDS